MSALLCLTLVLSPAQTVYLNPYTPGTLRVKVMVDNTDTPIPLALVQVNDSAGGVRFLYTDAGGYAYFPSTPVGVTYVVATKPGFQAGSAWIPWTGTTIIGVYMKPRP